MRFRAPVLTPSARLESSLERVRVEVLRVEEPLGEGLRDSSAAT
jgi:hypothetical protein